MACKGLPLLDSTVSDLDGKSGCLFFNKILCRDNSCSASPDGAKQALLRLECMEHPLPKQRKSGLSVHHTFDELDFRHLAFRLSIVGRAG